MNFIPRFLIVTVVACVSSVALSSFKYSRHKLYATPGACKNNQITNMAAAQQYTITDGSWSPWFRVADIGNGSVSVSYKLNGMDKQGNIIGWPRWRIKNTCTNLDSLCYFNFRFEYTDSEGKLRSTGINVLKLCREFVDESKGNWFMGNTITQTVIPGSMVIR
jgi:hypothetical protein